MNKALTKYKTYLSIQLKLARKTKAFTNLPLVWQSFYSVTFGTDCVIRRTNTPWRWFISCKDLENIFSDAFMKDFENEL